MADTVQTTTLASVTNETDPKVVFDAKFSKTTVAKHWAPQDSSEEGAVDNSRVRPNQDNLRIDGIYIPIIKINTQVIPNNDIITMTLQYTGFKPSLYLTLRKANYLELETPGMVNKVTVVIMPAVDGTYKKISVDFYITNISESGNRVYYTCDYFFPHLELKSTRVIKNDAGNKLSTYDLLEAIAKESELGFATTDMCKDIADNKIRLVRSQNLQEVIQEHLKFSGLDENSFFDAWIDVYGYLVLCNTAWVLNKAVSLNELSTHFLEGMNLYDSNSFKENAISFGENTFRTFTNWKSMPKKVSNGIEKYEWIINNSGIKMIGTDNTYYTVDHIANGGTNSIVSENIKIEEDSPDGKNYKNAYTFQKTRYIGVELGNEEDGNTPVLYQEKRRNAYFAKIRNKQLKVVLSDANYGLERGHLININIFEYERENKAMMIKLIDNLSENGNTEVTPSYKPDNIEEILNNDDYGIPNLSVSGMYLIDGIEYKYSSANQKIVQTLYLIRKTPSRNYLNLSSLPKIDKDE